jgi:hypothetical protein
MKRSRTRDDRSARDSPYDRRMEIRYGLNNSTNEEQRTSQHAEYSSSSAPGSYVPRSGPYLICVPERSCYLCLGLSLRGGK